MVVLTLAIIAMTIESIVVMASAVLTSTVVAGGVVAFIVVEDGHHRTSADGRQATCARPVHRRLTGGLAVAA